MASCGVYTFEEVLELAKLINGLDNLKLEGIQAYAGVKSCSIEQGPPTVRELPEATIHLAKDMKR